MTAATISTERPHDRLVCLDMVGGPGNGSWMKLPANAVGYKYLGAVDAVVGYQIYAKICAAFGFWLQYVAFEPTEPEVKR